MSKKRIVMSGLLLVVFALVVYTFQTTGEITDDYEPKMYATIWSLLPAVIAIGLALITKEVYSSLFVGIITGALLYSNLNLERMVNTLFFNEDGGMVYKLADSWNVGILIFLVVLGIMVALMNKAGGSAAFGNWASGKIKTREGSQFATMALGVLIFVDDYFNCLTVGSVMRPVTDKNRISRAKLAYIIDATAAPICIIAPISSWAAAVTSSVPENYEINGFVTFLKTIPYNYYALFTLVTLVFLIKFKVDFGPMKRFEKNAINGDIHTVAQGAFKDDFNVNPRGKVLDLVLPVVVLIIACIWGMVYTGGFFEGVDFITAFSNADASVGLVLGSFISLIFIFFYYMIREVITFDEFMACIPEGFRSMVSPILILTLAWTLSGMTGLLGGQEYVEVLVGGSAEEFKMFLPVIIYVVAMGLAFATGTSWGTFSILIPIVMGVFSSGEMMIISIAACLAGAVCGDHCSPISDTTIMASAGAQCDHVSHVSTQLPYALMVGAVSGATYVIAGVTKNVAISLIVGLILLLATLFIIKWKVGTMDEDSTVES